MATKKRPVGNTERVKGMFRRRSMEKVRRNAQVVFDLALRLAEDRDARKSLGSALEHIAKARQRSLRGRGLAGAARRLAADQPLQAELLAAGRDLRQAYALVDAKRRRRPLPRITPLAALASLAAAPQVRERLLKLIATGSDTTDTSGSDAASKPIEDLTKEELYTRAQQAEIPGRSDMSKDELITALRANSS